MSSYPLLNRAYRRITGDQSCLELVDYLKPVDVKEAAAFSRVCSMIESSLGSDIVFEAWDLIREVAAEVPITPQDYSWVVSYDWFEYLNKCYVIGHPADQDWSYYLSESYAENPYCFIVQEQVDLFLWDVIDYYYRLYGITNIKPVGLVFRARDE